MTSNAEYWKNRDIQKAKKNIRSAKTVEKKLNKIYKDTARGIEEDIYKLFFKYAKDNKLSYQEATKNLSSAEYKRWRYDLMTYYQEAHLKGNEAVKIELETLAMKSRITRLEALMFEISKRLDNGHKYTLIQVNDLLTRGVIENYIETAYEVEKLIGHNPGLTMLSDSEVNHVIEMPWSGKNYSKRIWNNRTKLRELIEEEITKQIIAGEKVENISKRVAERMNQGYYESIRLVHTEHAYACAQGDKLAYEKLHVDKYVFTATLDSVTSKVCRRLDGKVYKLEEAVTGLNYPPMHPFCRSSTVPYIDVFDESDTRIARDRKGKNIYLKANVTYKQYEEAFKKNDFSKIIAR